MSAQNATYYRYRRAAFLIVLVAAAVSAAGEPAGAQSGLVTTNGPYRAAVGQSILMTGALNVTTAGVTPVQWFWTFGDGASASGQTVQKAYTVTGTFIVTLQVQTSQGSATASTTATITGQPGSMLISAGGPYSGLVGQPIAMTATSQAFFVPATRWTWSFGDGTTAMGQSVQKTYSTPGAYTVTVGANTPEGAVTASTTATITAPAPVTVSVPLVPGCTNIISTWPDGTPPSTIAAAISPPGAVASLWRNEAGGLSFLAYAPTSPAATNNLLSVNRLEAIFICTTTDATLSRPVG